MKQVATKPVWKSDEGLWVVTRPAAQWLAWREWMAREFGKTFFPKALTVWSEWPPTTHAAAAIVAGEIARIREEIDFPQPTNRAPEPWRMWTLPEEKAQVARFLAQENPEPIPLHRVNAVIEATKKKYYGRRFNINGDEVFGPGADAPLTPSKPVLSPARQAAMAQRERDLRAERLAFVERINERECVD